MYASTELSALANPTPFTGEHVRPRLLSVDLSTDAVPPEGCMVSHHDRATPISWINREIFICAATDRPHEYATSLRKAMRKISNSGKYVPVNANVCRCVITNQCSEILENQRRKIILFPGTVFFRPIETRENEHVFWGIPSRPKEMSARPTSTRGNQFVLGMYSNTLNDGTVVWREHIEWLDQYLTSAHYFAVMRIPQSSPKPSLSPQKEETQ